MFSIDYIKEWSESYKTDLTTNIMPFWLKYGLDKVNGGIYTCVDRDGSLMDTTKSVWFQGRFAFICSYAYNNIEKNEAWLAAAKSTIDFIEAHCFDSDGRMVYTSKEKQLYLAIHFAQSPLYFLGVIRSHRHVGICHRIR